MSLCQIVTDARVIHYNIHDLLIKSSVPDIVDKNININELLLQYVHHPISVLRSKFILDTRNICHYDLYICYISHRLLELSFMWAKYDINMIMILMVNSEF